jgi:hypothetical protein
VRWHEPELSADHRSVTAFWCCSLNHTRNSSNKAFSSFMVAPRLPGRCSPCRARRCSPPPVVWPALGWREASGSVCCDFRFVAMSADERLGALLPDAVFELALIRANSFPWPGRAVSFAAGFELALSGQSHLNHSGQSCADASADISPEMTANPATKRRPVIVSSPTACQLVRPAHGLVIRLAAPLRRAMPRQLLFGGSTVILDVLSRRQRGSRLAIPV